MVKEVLGTHASDWSKFWSRTVLVGGMSVSLLLCAIRRGSLYAVRLSDIHIHTSPAKDFASILTNTNRSFGEGRRVEHIRQSTAPTTEVGLHTANNWNRYGIDHPYASRRSPVDLTTYTFGVSACRFGRSYVTQCYASNARRHALG